MDAEYDLVAAALAQEIFGASNAGRPVYALPDTESLARALAVAAVEGSDDFALGKVVRRSLALDEPGISPFRHHADASAAHRLNPLEVPTALPMLVLLTLAAERMHAGEDFAAHNYYSRLHELLGIRSASQHRVESDYRRHAELLWGSLNAWLEAWEGERGIPTAYAVGGHAYIGLPMSQAVVRRHDRDGLHEFFLLEGLTPGLRISTSDMAPAMEPYASATPSPFSSHIRYLWGLPTARERIVEAACLELEAWDGSGLGEASGSRQVASTRLLAFVRRFPSRSVEFNLMLPYRSDEPDIARFALSASETRVPTIVGPGGSTRLAGVSDVSAVSLVAELLSGHLGDGESRPFSRRPRRVAPLRWDDLQGAYVENERISLGEENLVIVRGDARARTETHLSEHARPGWTEADALPGTPNGWLLYQHVQMISAPSTAIHLDLLPLVPRARTSLTLRGGFVIPGLLRKWSALEPPEIVALAAGASTVTVRVYAGARISDNHVQVDEHFEDELGVVPLVNYSLVDGEYVVAMFVDGAMRASSTALLRLRSADSPQFNVTDVDIRLVYSPGDSELWPLSAGPATGPRYVNGPRAIQMAAAADPLKTVAAPEFAPRVSRGVAARAAPVRIGIAVADDSCLVTGRHRFQLPTAGPGAVRTRTLEGECTTCGLVRRFAGTPWAARRRDKSAAQASRAVAIPPVAISGEPDLEVAFDVLNHVGHGNYATFEKIAAQVEGSGLLADTLLRRQEVVGHVDVMRDEWLRPAEWAVNGASLVPLGEGRWALIGSRTRSMVERLRAAVGPHSTVVESVDGELAHVEVVGTLDVSALEGLGIVVLSESPALAIAQSLPFIGEIELALKRTSIPAYRTVELWDTGAAVWVPTDSIGGVGAYRLKDFSATYALRSANDLETGTIAVGNAQLVKHLANMWASDPLLGYHTGSRSVVVPLGADLPGLYGRALAVCSGRAPRELLKNRMLQYQSVPRDVADVVFTRLTQ